ncbi:MAG: hypothetical protein NDF56_06110 [archaeon GB-1845-036]|nr:hypothetical protein [Candidatus Culexmicrobium thermophilum]HDO20386.1 hypothetical protein [Candidatus Bathyarchaeota archaeon]
MGLEASTIIIEIAKNDISRRMKIISQLHRNQIIYELDDMGNILIDGFGLEKRREKAEKNFFIKYELKDGNVVKWVYVKMEEPDIYYRIKALYCVSRRAYIDALKKRMLPPSYINLAKSTLRCEVVKG